MFLKFRTHLWEHEDHFIEFLVIEETNHGVVLRTHTCTSWVLGQKGDLAEELSSFKSSYEYVFLGFGIFNKYFTFTLFDKEESVVVFSLIDKRKLWVQKHKSNRSNEEIDQI